MLCGPLGYINWGECVKIIELSTPYPSALLWDREGQISVSIQLGLGIIFPLSGYVSADLVSSGRLRNSV